MHQGWSNTLTQCWKCVEGLGMNEAGMRLYTYAIASDLGLLTPVFVACCTNAGEGLVKLIMCNDVWQKGTLSE